MACEKHGYTNNTLCPACDLETVERHRTSNEIASTMREGCAPDCACWFCVGANEIERLAKWQAEAAQTQQAQFALICLQEDKIAQLERELSALKRGSPSETFAVRPTDCKHERAKVQCPDCGIDFLGGIRTAPRDVPIWICSVCGGWNHVQDKFCTHTHAAQSPEKASGEPT